MWIDYVFGVYTVVALLALIIIGIRMWVVFRYRFEMLDKIHDAGMQDIDNDLYGKGSVSRWDMLDSVSVDTMLIQFWRRCDSFWPDLEWLKPLPVPPPPSAVALQPIPEIEKVSKINKKGKK